MYAGRLRDEGRRGARELLKVITNKRYEVVTKQSSNRAHDVPAAQVGVAQTHAVILTYQERDDRAHIMEQGRRFLRSAICALVTIT